MSKITRSSSITYCDRRTSRTAPPSWERRLAQRGAEAFTDHGDWCMPPYSLPCALRSRRSASGSPARASNRPACASASASRASVSVSRCLAQKAPSMWSTGMSYWIDRIKRRQDESKTPAQPLHRQARHMKSARHVSHVGPNAKAQSLRIASSTERN